MGSKFGSEIQFVIGQFGLVLLELSNHLFAPAAASSESVEALTASLNSVDSIMYLLTGAKYKSVCIWRRVSTNSCALHLPI